ncbi:hypothetical protein L0F81_24000 [Streptomyces tricolor]|uniref:Uncharacterized protein n=1 Tax=Streptomyces tricolor TaxID=68277 RepID=A0ABS9JL76_9ACTN|nr:hypothetical protein [Streptomyces tricolor]MCG0066315.1 hypothetical protein [Streptomyces tricolor]
MTVQIPEEQARLHRLISVHEVPLTLPAAALTGEACVWCLSPADGAAVEPEPSNPLPRRACTACYTARCIWYTTWYDWHLHLPTAPPAAAEGSASSATAGGPCMS